jgi:hypothetical protein
MLELSRSADQRTGAGDAPLAPAPIPIAGGPGRADPGPGQSSVPTAGAELRALSDSAPVAPDQLPAGTALTGRAPTAVVAGVGNYTPFVPTSIKLPSGRRAVVQPAGVLGDGALDVPSDPDRVGWWTGGAEAGEPYGSVVLAGHVDIAGIGVGVLAEMLTMRPGQELTLGDGRQGQTYRVQTVRTVAKAKLTAGTGLFDQGHEHRLVLITCGGPFDRHTHRYRDNVVIVAAPVGQ